jgi:hypothetical protein
MTLFDYRTEAFAEDPVWLEDTIDKPTFMYVMPLTPNADGKVRNRVTNMVKGGVKSGAIDELRVGVS